jgi:hypothetical protein
LLRRRLQGLFGDAFQIQVTSEVGKGTTVMMRIPLRKRLKAETESAFAAGFRQWIDGVRKDRSLSDTTTRFSATRVLSHK